MILDFAVRRGIDTQGYVAQRFGSRRFVRGGFWSHRAVDGPVIRERTGLQSIPAGERLTLTARILPPRKFYARRLGEGEA